MSLKKKIISAVCVLGLTVSALTFSGCSSANVSTALTIDGREIPAGVYILYSGAAYGEAQTQFEEENPDIDTNADDFDFKAQTVGGKSVVEFVKEKTLEACKRYVAISKLYEEGGMTFTEKDTQDLADAVSAQWDCDLTSWVSYLPFAKGYDTLGDYYEHIGVSKASLREFYNSNQFKASILFDSYYEKGGSREVADSEINTYIDENYVLTRYFTISLLDDDRVLIEDAAKLEELEKLADDYAKMLNDGTAYKDVYDKYQSYLNPDKEDNADTSDTDEEETKDSDYNRVVNKEDKIPSTEFVEALFKQSKNTAEVFKAEENLYVVQKLDILTESLNDTKYTDSYRSDALLGLKSDEFESILTDTYANYTAEMNNRAPDYCKEQAANAAQGLAAVSQIQYYSYYSSLFGGY